TWRMFGCLAMASWSGKAKTLPHSESFGFFEHRVAQRDVGQRKSPMPEQVGLGVPFAARLEAGDDLSELRMQRRRGQLSCLDVCAKAAELAVLALPPVVDHQFRHYIGQRQLDPPHLSVGYDEGPLPYPFRFQQRRRFIEPGSL